MSIADSTSKPEPNVGIAGAALETLKAQFGDRLAVGQAIREQHGHTLTWIPNQPPDAVVFPQSAAEVRDVVNVCAAH